MTFADLRAYGQALYKDSLADREALDKIIAEMTGVYEPAYILKKRTELENTRAEALRERADSLKEKADELIAEKRAYLEKMLSTPPTEEQTNLLNALSIRGAEVEEAEYQKIAGQLAPNYQALKALQAIAQKNGKRVPLPDKYDYEVLTEKLDWTEKYLADRIRGLRSFITERKAGFYDRLFFKDGYRDNVYSDHAIDLFD